MGLTKAEFKDLKRVYRVFDLPVERDVPILEDNGKGGYKISGFKKAAGTAPVTECVSAQRKLYQELKKFDRNVNYRSKLHQLPTDREVEALQNKILTDVKETQEITDGKSSAETNDSETNV